MNKQCPNAELLHDLVSQLEGLQKETYEVILELRSGKSLPRWMRNSIHEGFTKLAWTGLRWEGLRCADASWCFGDHEEVFFHVTIRPAPSADMEEFTNAVSEMLDRRGWAKVRVETGW
jgi:hypothetical protein